MTSPAARLAWIALLAAGLSGCARSAGSADGRAASLDAGSQGASWEAVLGSPRVTMLGGDADAGPEARRRDAALGVTHARALTAIDSWPQAERATLDRARHVTVPRTPERLIYWRARRDSARPPRGW